MVGLRTDPDFKDLAHGWRGQKAADLLVEETLSQLADLRPDQLALFEPLARALLEQLEQTQSRPAARRALLAVLDTVRRKRFTRQLTPDQVPGWTSLVLEAVEKVDFTYPQLVLQREQTDPDAVALRVLGPDPCELTVADLARRTRAIARGLLSLLGDDREGRVALLSENCLDGALVDLACLSNGIVDIPVPANIVADQIQFVLRHCGARVLVLSDEEQAAKVLPLLPSLPELREVVMMSGATAEARGMLSLSQLVEQGALLDDEERARRAAAVKSSDLATVMYTSGTTGQPKGIAFSHLNLMSKRFARGFALPGLGEGDVFLSYLPLYHTFGRWLEMTGSLYWGATYVFARSPARATLLEDFGAVRPTVFISVPKKWMELREQACREVGSEDPDLVAAQLKKITGGQLRWGLSAAGYLDPLVFRSFRSAGVELNSGYGMTEATGGVTMTPVGEYVDGSIGKALPGIELKVAGDGELLMRGPYVMLGYLNAPPGDSGLDAEGWFATGDLVQQDERGHVRIVGRKKEIYKNRKGQTIAPQRVENLFRDFDAVGQAVLVGDHREFNTLLIWPDFEGQKSLQKKSPQELRELLGSLVASANRFLAPFERVVDYALLDRPLSADHGELTAKLTYKRDVVEKHFAHLIEPMYQELHISLSVGGFEVTIPNWVMREIGVLKEDLAWRDGELIAHQRSMPLEADPSRPGTLRVGDFHYRPGPSGLDLGEMLGAPCLWLGNESLRRFVGEEAFLSLLSRRAEDPKVLELDPRAAPPCDPRRASQLMPAVGARQASYPSLHAAAALLRGSREQAEQAVKHLERALHWGRGELASLARAILRRASELSDPKVQQEAFQALLPGEEPSQVVPTLRRFLERAGPALLSEETLVALAGRSLSEGHVSALLDLVEDHARELDRTTLVPSDRALVLGAARLLTAAAVARPVHYARLRITLARLAQHRDPELAARAGEDLDRLQLWFRSWIGPNQRLAVDLVDDVEYGWREVLVFDEGVPLEHREQILRAVVETSLVREAVFLFGKGALVSLSDIPPSGVWITRLDGGGNSVPKVVYRLSLQTRSGESYDLVLNLAEGISLSEMREEIRWLQAAGAPPPLVEQFGSYYGEHALFTEEFVPGETVERQVARLSRQGALERLKVLWPFHACSAFAAHIAFWERTGRKLALAAPTPASVIVPSHDYQVGTRLVSITHRTPCESARELLERFQSWFVRPTVEAHPELDGLVHRDLLLSAFFEALGEAAALQLLDEEGDQGFAQNVRKNGYVPLPLHFGIERYRRWLAVNPQALAEAKAATVHDLWDTYALDRVQKLWPDVRVRFFLETVFAQARPELRDGLERVMALHRALRDVSLSEQLGALRARVAPTAEEDYFLARMTWRHLTPTDEASLVTLPTGEKRVSEVAVTLSDAEGDRICIRSPISPREVSKLLQVFSDAGSPVVFAAEHEFLLALDAKESVLGGLYYHFSDPETVYMDRVVVARAHRNRGVSDALMGEFKRRLKGRGVKVLETGFLYPEYTMRFGFRTGPRHGGLFVPLDEETTRT
jgi:long-chain acyl-CoA synthetase